MMFFGCILCGIKDNCVDFRLQKDVTPETWKLVNFMGWVSKKLNSMYYTHMYTNVLDL